MSFSKCHCPNPITTTTTMKYKLLGRSGLRVSEICLGTMTMGEEWGYGADAAESYRQYKTFVDAGGNFIDTANRYTEGTSERLLGSFMKDMRQQIVMATKYSLRTALGGVNDGGNHRKNMVESLESSLRRLDTDYVDVFYLHAWDFTTPVDEVMRGLDDLVRSGKVLYVAISDTPAWIVSRANTMAELRGWSRFIGCQVEYSLIQRTPERDLLPMADALELGVTAWAPLAGGALTGKYLNAGANDDLGRTKAVSIRRNERSTAIAQKAADIAKEKGCTPTQVALSWVRQQGSCTIPIVGARTADQLKDSLGCVDVVLNTEELAALNAVSAIELGFPHDFLATENVRNLTTGNQYHNLIQRKRD